MRKYWKNTMEYRRILEILDDYWLAEPEEDFVRIDMHFEKGDETQDKLIIWRRPIQERTAQEPPELVPANMKAPLPPKEAISDVIDKLFASGFSVEEILDAFYKAQYKISKYVGTYR